MAYDPRIVPVVMFHSVGLAHTGWVFSHISEPLDLFESKLEILAKRHYHTIHWAELFGYMEGSGKLPPRTVMLTFDDGYLDNWVYVFPLLQRYGLKATIFVSPEFVDPSSESRPTTEDLREGKVREADLISNGFLCYGEMRRMINSGLVDIQSHAMTHTWYFSSPKVLDFHRPGNKTYPWLAWNARPELKPFYMANNQDNLIRWGTPIYEYAKALICRRFFPSEIVADRITNFVSENGGADYFHTTNWESRLRELHSTILAERPTMGRYESDGEYEKRVFRELAESKRLLEYELDRKVNFICWPGGAYNPTVLRLAREAGYKSWTLASADDTGILNRPGSNPRQIKRMGSGSRHKEGKADRYLAALYFASAIERHKGSFAHKWLGRFIALCSRAKSILPPRGGKR